MVQAGFAVELDGRSAGFAVELDRAAIDTGQIPALANAIRGSEGKCPLTGQFPARAQVGLRNDGICPRGRGPGGASQLMKPGRERADRTARFVPLDHENYGVLREGCPSGPLASGGCQPARGREARGSGGANPPVTNDP
jgi:hypothetical protein